MRQYRSHTISISHLDPVSRPQFWTGDPNWFQSYPLPPPASTPTSEGRLRSWVWRDWLEYSTFHGILDLRHPRYGKCWKTCWIFVIVLFAGLAVYSIQEVIDEYLTNPTIQNYKEASNSQFGFPDVVLCTHQRINESELRAMGASTELIHALMDTFEWPDTSILLQKSLSPPNLDWESNRASYAEFRSRNGNISFDQTMRRAGVSCESLVKTCTWDSPGHHCCEAAQPYLDRLYGQCYRFQKLVYTKYGPPTSSQTYPGPGSGIQMVFRSQSDPSSRVIEGALVEFVHPEEPLMFSFSQIPAGVSATVHLSLQVTQRINMFGRPRTCYEPSEQPIQNHTNGQFSLETLQKSANGCFYAMWSKATAKYCNCTLMPNIAEIPYCEPFETCTSQYQQAIQAETDALQAAKCLPQCTHRSYSVSISYSKFNAAAFNRMMKASNASIEDLVEDDLILLDIYHPRMEYLTVQEVEVYSVMTLISNIGGAVGLWLGASLMSILQVVFYLAKWVSVKK